MTEERLPTIQLYRHRKHRFWIGLLGTLMIAMAVWNFIDTWLFYRSGGWSEKLIIRPLLGGIVFLGLGISNLLRSKRKELGLIISSTALERMLRDQPELIINWNEVERVAQVEHNGEQRIGLFPKNRDASNKHLSFDQRQERQKSLETFGTLLVLNPKDFSCPDQPLVDLLRQYHQAATRPNIVTNNITINT